MKIQTSELIGAPLDWAVAEALKPTVKKPDRFGVGSFGPLFGKGYLYPTWRMRKFDPSVDWAKGGPIIEREQIDLTSHNRRPTSQLWQADNAQDVAVYGPTPLIAAMRCFVASKLGEEIDVPDELLL